MLVEMLLLPGINVGAALSIGSFAGAICIAFYELGNMAGFATIAISALLAVALFLWSTRAGAWSSISLNEQVNSTSSTEPSKILPIGSCGVTMSRIAPMGRARFDDVIIEAKSLGSFIDPKSAVEVVGYENAAVVVKLIKK